MKKSILFLLLAIGILFVAVFTVSGQEADTVVLTLLGTNDMHSYAIEKPDSVKEGEVAKTGRIGYAKIAAYKKSVAENGPVLLFDAGDTTHGQVIATLLEGESIIWLMNEAGYDGMTAGNHDFNYGYQKVIDFDYMADFPILISNLTYKDTGMNVMPQYAIYNVGDIKVGVFGVMTPETYYKSSPVNTEGLDITDPYEAGKKMSEFLRPHVDVVVALSHLGVDGGSEFVSTGLAEAAPEIDVIFDGHSHTLMEEPVIVGDTLIIQGGEHGRNISQVKVTLKLGESATDRMTIVSKEGSLVTYEALMETEPDADVLDMTTRFRP